jgi:hypothetical protein
MIKRAPPRIATWLLERLGPAYRNESLVGDLFEEYQQDRTHVWYWRQVIMAIFIGQASSARRLLPRLAARGPKVRRTDVPRRNTPIRRLLSVFAFTALSAGTLAWAGAAPRTPHQCTLQGSSAIDAALDGHAVGR